MKKFTALMLVVLMVVSFVPFGAFAATEWTEVKTAEDFAKMTDGNYWLTADIDLSKAAWTTIAEFSGTLNGNGKTVTVPADAPIIDKLTGTVKNVNLKGAMSLDDADRSALHVAGNHNSHPLGVLANYAQGATVENVHSAVELTYVSGRTAKPSAWTSVGGLIGIAMADYTIEEKDGTKNVKFGDGTTIKNVSNTGKMNLDFVQNMNGNRDNLGGILAGALGYVDLSLVLVSAEMTVANTGGNKGGIVGYIYSGYESKLTGASANVETEEMGVTLTDCLYNGSYKISGNTGERWAGIVGYAHNAKLTNCVNEGTGEGGNVGGIVGYGNCNGGKGVHGFVITNIAALGPKGCGNWTSIKGNESPEKSHLEFVNIALLEENKLNSAGDSDRKGEVQTNVVTYKTKPEVRTAFLANGASNFEVKNDVLTLKMPAFTPEADPFTPAAPTFDFATIDSAEEFAAFTKAVNDGSYVPATNSVVKVTADLDMKDITDFQPINSLSGYDLDFQGHTVSNLVVKVQGADKNAKAALIAINVVHKRIDNLKLYNCMLIATNVNRAALFVDDFNRGGYNNIEIENCTLNVTHHPDATGKEVSAVNSAYNYDTKVNVNVKVKNVLIESTTAAKVSAVVGCLWRGTNYNLDSASVENVSLKNGDTVTPVTNILAVPEGGGFASIKYDPANVTVTNTANATGYVDPTTPETPETPDTPAPTGDMTIVLGAVALVSLAAVTVIAKKKVTE